MRDLEFYQLNYDEIPYEKYQIKYRKRKVIEVLKKHKHEHIVEIGCGFSSIINDINDYLSIDIIEPGNAFSNKAIEDALVVNDGKKITIYKEYFENWIPQINDKKPDFILISCLLHEVENAEPILKKCYDISSSETIIHINVPNAKSFHRLLAVETGIIKDIYEKSENQLNFQQYCVFDMESLIKLVSGIGFEVIENGYFSFKPFTHKQMQKMIDMEIINEEILEGLFRMEKYMYSLGSEMYVNLKKI